MSYSHEWVNAWAGYVTIDQEGCKQEHEFKPSTDWGLWRSERGRIEYLGENFGKVKRHEALQERGYPNLSTIIKELERINGFTTDVFNKEVVNNCGFYIEVLEAQAGRVPKNEIVEYVAGDEGEGGTTTPRREVVKDTEHLTSFLDYVFSFEGKVSIPSDYFH